MIDLGPHAAFIWVSYAAVAVTVAGLIVWLIADGRKQHSDLDALERQGVRRRGSVGVR
ncbi:heme exporter protein CcmD [Hyphomicrobium sp.]|uniref:heme exporter protein CcmD n=1 Tax=Hyphomicrobium sp. TaxID=82 RepID=UPI002D78E470|nr:heme exporter protein CcmD [Hyphomicrobium sp.]HET6388783.1 heme exporter protein CcmD [Hyphomicrobium sp.]